VKSDHQEWNIDITAHNNYAITWACENGHIDMVKFILSIRDEYPEWNIDITAHNNYAIISACRNGHIDMVK
jgi:ankyrin repeat protein